MYVCIYVCMYVCICTYIEIEGEGESYSGSCICKGDPEFRARVLSPGPQVLAASAPHEALLATACKRRRGC